MTTEKPNRTARPRLSPTAKVIVDNYRLATKGHGQYLTQHMHRAELADAMYAAMLSEYPRRPDTPISEYVEAMGEARDYLDL